MKISNIAFLSIIFLAQSTYALRCERQVIQEGDHQMDVAELCGEPAWRQNWYKDNTAEAGHINHHDSGNSSYYRERASVESTIEEWIYDFGPRRLKQRILFENGYVVKITPLVK